MSDAEQVAGRLYAGRNKVFAEEMGANQPSAKEGIECDIAAVSRESVSNR